MSALGPGVMLLCITDKLQPIGISHGRIYECEAVVPAQGPCGICADAQGEGLRLVGLPLPLVYGIFPCALCPCAFVPAGGKGEFETLLKVEPVREDA